MVTKLGALGNPRTAVQKLKPPSIEERAIDRPRLICALDTCFDLDRAFVMVSAPAGFGKTYLLAQWAKQRLERGTLVAWCSLTEDDRDARVLWNTVLDAIAHSAHDADPQLSTAIGDLVPEFEPLAHSCFLARLDSALTAHDGAIAVILDSTELLEGTDAEHELIDCLQYVPDNVRIAFATRSSLQTQAARVSGRLVEITAEQLSFTRSETGQLFALHGIVNEGIEELHEAADGWPAALGLAAAGVSAMNDLSTMHSYLRNEVLDHLDERSTRLLLAMGVAPMITAELAVELTGDVHSASLLRVLAADNHLVYRHSVDEAGRVWYRVHRLFGSFLREQLRERDPQQLIELTELAVAWHVEFGDAVVALQLANDPPRARLVERVLRLRGYGLVGDGHASELLALMPSLTGATLRRPFTRLMMAYAAVTSARPDRAEELLAAPHLDELSADDLLEWDWLNYLVRLHLAIATGRSPSALSSGWSVESLDTMPAQLQVAVRLAEGLAEARVGQAQRATDSLRLALAAAENSDDLSARVLGTVGLAASAAMGCDFRLAYDLARNAIELSADATTQNQTDSLSVAHGLAAWSANEMLDVGAARSHAAAALILAEEHGDAQLIAQARHVHNDAHFDLITEKRRAAQDYVTSWPPSYLSGTARTAVVASVLAGMRMSAHLSEPRWSERLLDRARQSFGEDYDWQVLYALHLITTGRDDSARSVIGPLATSALHSETSLTPIIAATMDGVLKSRANNEYQAHAAIFHALELADEAGAYLELTRVDSRAMARLLVAGSGRFGPHEHIARLVLASDSGDGLLSSGSLTTRERQILAELRTLRTVDEIAHDLLLSVNTVKTHMRGIYRKLDVTSRRQAVTTAERYGLL